MLNKEDTVFVLVDVQGKLAEIVHESDTLLKNLDDLINGLRVLGIPILWLEQYPKGLGQTNEKVAQHLDGYQVIEKRTFNACKNEEFMKAFNSTGRKQVLVAGIEAHVCVYQTSMGLNELGYEVQIVADAVSSRTEENKEIGLEKMKESGIALTSVEIALFELLETSEGELFKQVLQFIK